MLVEQHDWRWRGLRDRYWLCVSNLERVSVR
jgi:hypothetical protein